jgi:hypothetical protein
MTFFHKYINKDKYITRVAIIKYGGMSAGGTEKFLQNIALNLNPNRFYVEYFYCNSSPYIGSDFKHPDSDKNIIQKFYASPVKLTEFTVGFKNILTLNHIWIDTNFFELFSEKEFDVVLAGRAGHREYPFDRIKKIPIVDSLHFNGGVDNQLNIFKTLFLSKESRDTWVSNGGNRKRSQIISHPIGKIEEKTFDFRAEFGIKSKWIIGLHQRPSDEIFSSIPLSAFQIIKENFDVSFVILGGSNLYKNQAENIPNVHFIPASSDPKVISSFLLTLDIYAHGRKDGEINSTAIAEAMSAGLPIVSHVGTINNGHIEQIGNAGKVCLNIVEYVQMIESLLTDDLFRIQVSENSLSLYNRNYNLKSQIQIIEGILIDAADKNNLFKFNFMLFHNYFTNKINRMRYLISKFTKFRIGK